MRKAVRQDYGFRLWLKFGAPAACCPLIKIIPFYKAMMDLSSTSENVRSTSFENVRSSSSENVRLMSTTDGKKQVDDTTKQINDEEKPKPPPTLKECSPTWFWRVGVHLLLLVVPVAYLGKLNIICLDPHS